MPLLNDNFFDHPTTRELQFPEPILLHIAAMSYCEYTDSRGFLDLSALRVVIGMVGNERWHISKAKAIKRLVKVGWWVESEEGYLIPPTDLFKYTRRSLGKNNPTRSKFKAIRKGVFEYLSNLYGSECVYCGATEDLTVDHIKPIFKGGTNSIDNLQILCRRCNCRKHVRDGN